MNFSKSFAILCFSSYVTKLGTGHLYYYHEPSPCKTIAAAIQPTFWIRVICIIFLLANNSRNEKDLSDRSELLLALENICLSGISSDAVESFLIVSSPVTSSEWSYLNNRWPKDHDSSSIPDKDWSDDEFDIEKKLLIVVESLHRGDSSETLMRSTVEVGCWAVFLDRSLVLK